MRVVQEINKIAVIGAGEMGHGIAQAALLAGLPVSLYDTHEAYLNRGVKRIYESLDKLLAKQKINQEAYQFSKRSLYPTLDFRSAVSDVQFVFEAVPEVLEIKQKVFKKLEETTSVGAILASNTSNMSISEIAKHAQSPDRIVGVHFFNPVVLMKLVEVIKGSKTSDVVMQMAYDLCLQMNKTPVRVEKDTPGFIVNRINAPVRVYLGAVVDKGIAEPEEIDALLKSSGDPMGHFELSDFIGLDTVYHSSLYRATVLHAEYGPCKELEKKVKTGQLGKKSGQGFYDWSQGRPIIDLSRKTDKVTVGELRFIKLNEATKLIEAGIASAKDIDIAITLGTGDKVGPIEACKDVGISEIISQLDRIASSYNKEILKPTKLLRENFDSLYV